MNWRTDVKKWIHSLSVWWASALLFIGSALELVQAQFGLISPYLGKWSGAALMGIGLVNLWLRARTSKPLAGTKAARQP